jgi:hypothetical protein
MNTTAQKTSFWASFSIKDRESCAKAIRNGGIAAMISAGITSIFGLAGFFTNSSNQALNYFLDPWTLIDVVLIVMLGFFVFRKSRIAATLLVIYFVSGKLMLWASLGKPTGLIVSLVFFLYYVTAMKGTYLWNSRFHDNAIDTEDAQPTYR